MIVSKKFSTILILAMLMNSTSLAAENPFADVPAGHWAYSSVTKLAAEGVIEGYGDGTFLGNRNITRYEMAQMIAKAMAKNPTGANKFELDKLAAEFRSELDSLGVRVAELEKHSDKLTWSGGIGYEYLHTRIDGGIKDGLSENIFKIELYPRAEINENWSANAKIEAYTNVNYKDSYTDEYEHKVSLERIYAEGNYKNFLIQLGKVPVLSENDNNMIIDGEASGVQIVVGDKYKFKIFAGKYVGAEYQFAEFYNDREEKFNFGLGYHRLHSEGYRYIDAETNGYYDSSNINIFSVGMKYRFDKNFALIGSFAQNPSGKNYASTQRRAYSLELAYKEADMEDPGSYEIFAAYRKLGHMAVIEPTYDVMIFGMKGFHFGAEYIFAKNISGQIQYFIGEIVTPYYQGRHTNKIYCKLEYDF